MLAVAFRTLLYRPPPEPQRRRPLGEWCTAPAAWVGGEHAPLLFKCDPGMPKDSCYPSANSDRIYMGSWQALHGEVGNMRGDVMIKPYNMSL